MTSKQSNAPAPDELLLTARESLKSVLRKPEGDHAYTVLMVMNAIGIAARAMGAGAPVPAHARMDDAAFRDWIRQADEGAIGDPDLIEHLRGHAAYKLSISNPRFKAETRQEDQ